MSNLLRHHGLRVLLGVAVVGAAGLVFATRLSMRDFPNDLNVLTGTTVKSQVLARDGTPLSHTLENNWNTTDTVPLTAVPALLQTALIVSEDQHFYEHGGVDWPARVAAAVLDVRKGGAVRGASSITEQVVRMVHPRPRTLWSRWVEGFEAMGLNSRLSKEQILEFYSNQVPYADRRRGVVQAARLYFRRGLDTCHRVSSLRWPCSSARLSAWICAAMLPGPAGRSISSQTGSACGGS